MGEWRTLLSCAVFGPGFHSKNWTSTSFSFSLYELSILTHAENFPSVVKLYVFDCPELKRITALDSRLQKIRIVRCTKLEVLEGVTAPDSLVLQDTTMETLPGYLRAVNPRYLKLYCNKKLYESSSSPGSSEWDKISHIGRHNIVQVNCILPLGRK